MRRRILRGEGLEGLDEVVDILGGIAEADDEGEVPQGWEFGGDTELLVENFVGGESG
jgi:hypothetical protein